MVGGWVGGMRANTETSRSSARAQAATTMSISPNRWPVVVGTELTEVCVFQLSSSGLGTEPRGSLSRDGKPKTRMEKFARYQGFS